MFNEEYIKEIIEEYLPLLNEQRSFDLFKDDFNQSYYPFKIGDSIYAAHSKYSFTVFKYNLQIGLYQMHKLVKWNMSGIKLSDNLSMADKTKYIYDYKNTYLKSDGIDKNDIKALINHLQENILKNDKSSSKSLKRPNKVHLRFN